VYIVIVVIEPRITSITHAEAGIFVEKDGTVEDFEAVWLSDLPCCVVIKYPPSDQNFWRWLPKYS